MIEKVNEVSGVMMPSSVKNKKGPFFEQDMNSAHDALAVSDFAREMASISAEMKKVPEVRNDRVEDLRKQIEEGTYQPDLKLVAERLVWAGITRRED